MVELLTVIAVIGILAAILIPVVNSARATAREAANLSNLRQIGVASHLFAADNRDFFPAAFTPGVGDWLDRLLPYLNTASRGQSAGVVWRSPTAVLDSNRTARHYSINALIAGSTPLSRNQIPRPTQVILAADGAQSQTSGSANASFYRYSHAGQASTVPIPYDPATDVDAPAGDGYLRFRNRGSVHVVFVDGSARGLAAGKVLWGNIVANR